MNAKTKKTIGIGLLLVGALALTYVFVIKPKKEKTSNASGTPRGTAKNMAQVPCNQGGTHCSNGRMCKNGFCV